MIKTLMALVVGLVLGVVVSSYSYYDFKIYKPTGYKYNGFECLVIANGAPMEIATLKEYGVSRGMYMSTLEKHVGNEDKSRAGQILYDVSVMWDTNDNGVAFLARCLVTAETLNAPL